MIINYKSWQKLFLICLGLFTGTAFCMKWMEGSFLQNNPPFTILGLEISYPPEKLTALLSGLNDHVRSILRFHLYFDFVFMAGAYPGIAALCMMARQKQSHRILRKLLFVLACAQLLAWGCDIYENCCLLNWIRDPDSVDHYSTYHFIVLTKWVLALAGAILAIPLSLRKRKSVS